MEDEKIEKLVELCETLTEEVTTLKKSNKELSDEVKSLRSKLGAKSKEEEEADNYHAEELLKSLSKENSNGAID